MHRPITIKYKNVYKACRKLKKLYNVVGLYQKRHHKYSKSLQYSKGNLYYNSMITNIPGLRVSYPFHIYLPYYLYRVAVPVLVVSNSIIRRKLLNILYVNAHKVASRIRYGVHTSAYLLYMLANIMCDSAYLSNNSTILYMRNVYLSMMNISVDNYSQSVFYDNISTLYCGKYAQSQMITSQIKHKYHILSMFSKLYYLNSILVATNIKSDFFTDTFFKTVISIFDGNHALLTSLLHINTFSVSFYTYLHGNKSTRLFFALSKMSTSVSFYLTSWLFSRYGLLAILAHLYTIRFEILSSIYLILSKSSIIKHSTSFLNKMAIIHSHSRMLSNSIQSFRKCAMHINKFIIGNYHLSAYLCKLYNRFHLSVVDISLYNTFETFRKNALHNLTLQIENTLYSYHNVAHLFIARFYYRAVPPITNAKILCEYILIQLSNGLKIKAVFSRVSRWQKYWQTRCDNNTAHFIQSFGTHIGNFIYPLKGIRIICSGPPYKARRTTSSKYHV